ncbi:hypothetical protein GOP47_0002686 [Adiantum capillus-veneris]|uniref:Thioredoxin domain-containing protein n=1 Tax=Adiantum capillus-veneris TaxID=13818 RepID=A0A9D4ZPC7_ADICA|nr:hypothetical protein GOP47_0002686 [Adiantum capillus-veneris]
MQNSSTVDENNVIHCPSANSWMATVEDCIVANQLNVAMFYGSWSEPSKVMYDMMVQQKKDFPNVVFCKLDIDEVKEATKMMAVRIVPTIVFVIEGKEVARVKLLMTPEVFKHKIVSFLPLQQS